MNRSKKMKLISKSEASISVKPYDYSIPVLSVAISSNNVSVVKLLLSTGYDVNAKNEFGETSLLTALKLDKLEIVKLLLDKNADVRIIDPHTKFSTFRYIVIEWRNRHSTNPSMLNIIEDIVERSLRNLLGCNLEFDKLIEFLIASYCPLWYVMKINDHRVTKEFLKRNNPSADYTSEMIFAMNNWDVENVELILHYGNDFSLQVFFNQLNNELHYRFYIKHLSNWNVFLCEYAIQRLELIFETGCKEFVKMLLDYKIDAQVRDNFGIDCRVCIFSNKNIDAIDLLKNQDFDVNSRGMHGMTALHYAVKNNLEKNVKFLLESGADVDVKNYLGRTALLESIVWYSDKNVKILLEYGADAQINDSSIDEWTIFDYYTRNIKIYQPVIEQLAIDCMLGVPILDKIISRINSDITYQKYYESCLAKLEFFKTYEIIKSTSIPVTSFDIVNPTITLFTILTEKIETISRFLRDDVDFIQLLDDELFRHQANLYPSHYFYYLLKSKIMKAKNLRRFQCNIAKLISTSTGKLISYDHLIVSKISQYTTERDIISFEL